MERPSHTLSVDAEKVRAATRLQLEVTLSKDVKPGVRGPITPKVLEELGYKVARTTMASIVAEYKAAKELFLNVLNDRPILLLNRIGVYPGAAELMEAVMSMWKVVGLNVKLRSMEKRALRNYENQPYPKDVGCYMVHKTHDNNKGDAVFTVFYKYGSKGAQSATFDKKLDDLIAKATVATGEEREKLWPAAFNRIQVDIITDVMLYHMVSYFRVEKRINFDPSWMKLSEIPVKMNTFE